MKKIILGSASPRRKEILAQIGAEFTVQVSGKEEVYRSSRPEDIVRELALMKAENVASDLSEELSEMKHTVIKDTVILGADTVVVLDDRILGKPGDKAEAFEMLTRLQGRTHEVCTGVAALDFDSTGRKRVTDHAVVTKVFVHTMTEKEIRYYIATGEPMDKAGAYGIQGRFAPYIDRIEGDYYNVVGLPASYVYQMLKGLGAI